MSFEEPKVELVEIDASMVTENSCTSSADQSMGSATTCVNAGSDGNNCASLGTFAF